MQLIRVWDLPVRLFHALLAVAILGLFITANLGGNWMEWHKKIGFLVMGLIVFRVVWGFIGSYHARFINFVRAPSAVFVYAKGLLKPNGKHFLGHNPMGALSVLALLGTLAFQAITGLFSNDDIMLEGPYANTVSKALSDQMTHLHKLNSDLILILIGLHLAAVIFYSFYKKERLVKAMLTGDKIQNSSIDGHLEAKIAETPRPYWLSWLTVMIVGALVYALATRALG